MASTTWQSSSGDINAAASWTNGIPAVGNSPAVFDGRSQRSATINLSALSAANFEVKTMPEFRGNIGLPGAPLLWVGKGAADFHTIRGSGECHFQTTGADNFIIDTARSTSRIFLDILDLDGFYCKSGTVVISSTSSGDARIFIVDRSAHVTMRAAAAAEDQPLTIQVTGGTFVNQRDFAGGTVTDINVSGGRLIHTGGFITNTTFVQTGGITEYAPLGDFSAERPRLSILGGRFDVSDSEFTIDPILMVIGPDGTVIGSAIQADGELTDVDLRKLNP